MKNYEVIVRLENGMDGHVWQEENGWYGEVSDEGDYCQGCAWATTKKEAVEAVLEETDYIRHCEGKGYY